MRRLKVAIVTPNHLSARRGGAEFQTEQIARALAAYPEVEVFFLAKRIQPLQSSEHYDLVDVGCRWPIPAARGTMLDASNLWLALARLQPDVIYQRVACTYTAVAAAYARRRACRLVWHIAHDFDVTPGRFAGDATGPRVALEKRLAERAIRQATAIIAQTRSQAALLSRHYARPDAIVIPNGHPVPTEQSEWSDRKRVLWVANLKRWKRPELFVQLAQRFKDDRRLDFVMVGKPSPDRDWHQRIADAVAETPNLTYTGECPAEEVNRFLARAFLFVNTSEAEGFPNTFIQAWMRGVPVLSMNCDPDGTLSNGETGFLAPTLDALAERAASFAGDRAQWEAFKAAAREHAVARYSPANFSRVADLVMSTGRSPHVA